MLRVFKATAQAARGFLGLPEPFDGRRWVITELGSGFTHYTCSEGQRDSVLGMLDAQALSYVVEEIDLRAA